MKGGSFKRWYGNQEYVINYGRNGFELKAWANPLYGNSGWSRIIKSTEYYFRRGVTWTDLTSGRFSARLSVGGFVFDVSGSSAFPQDIELVLGVMNSAFAYYTLNLINPTVHVQVGDLSRLPIPSTASHQLRDLVEQAIMFAKADSNQDETTYDFLAPPAWEMGINDVAKRHRKLAEIEKEIDEEVYRLYGISDEDRAAIEVELAEPTTTVASDEEMDDSSSEAQDVEAGEDAPVTRDELVRQWISSAVGIVMGRFQPGIDGALGRGLFSEDIAVKLRALADSDGILVLDQGHSDDLATKVHQALQIMLGEQAAAEVVAEGTGRAENPEKDLRRYFESTFFKEHIQKYRKRPVYWLLQSPRKKYGIWLFHEKLTKDTLYRITGKQYMAQKINLLETDIAELRKQRDAAQGRKRRAFEKPIAEGEDTLDDLRAFAERIDAILQRGYTPHIDDGVLINMAPLWELMPSW
jgi:hypothetical protein